MDSHSLVAGNEESLMDYYCSERRKVPQEDCELDSQLDSRCPLNSPQGLESCQQHADYHSNAAQSVSDQHYESLALLSAVKLGVSIAYLIYHHHINVKLYVL